MKKQLQAERRAVRQYELLSPAGSEECLDAAIASGADAVYAGASRFGARAYAANFDNDSFLRAIDHVHICGRKLYLTLNTLIKEREFGDIRSFLLPFYQEGLDGVIVQDIGVIRFIHDEFPLLPIHASTQMSITTSYGVNYLKALGVSRVVPARELSLDEIKKIRSNTGMELECFIHGAMCCSYSGQCLMSSFLGGRSGNRGRCAGPCRQPYSCGRIKNRYFMSLKDMCTIDIMNELMDAGISSFKIEGRMKSPEYVGSVTEMYRKYMDMYLEKGTAGYNVSEADRNRLITVYSRGGKSEGYYKRHNGMDMVSPERGGYLRENTENYTFEKLKIPASISCTVETGRPVHIDITCMGETVSSEGAIAEAAKSRPMTRDDIIRHIGKAGDSDLKFNEIEASTDGQSFVAVSVLNAIRREAVSLLQERLINGYKRTV